MPQPSGRAKLTMLLRWEGHYTFSLSSVNHSGTSQSWLSVRSCMQKTLDSTFFWDLSVCLCVCLSVDWVYWALTSAPRGLSESACWWFCSTASRLACSSHARTWNATRSAAPSYRYANTHTHSERCDDCCFSTEEPIRNYKTDCFSVWLDCNTVMESKSRISVTNS